MILNDVIIKINHLVGQINKLDLMCACNFPMSILAYFSADLINSASALRDHFVLFLFLLQ